MKTNLEMKDRNLSIDIMKFIATFLILNSHMDILYVHYPVLATGGAIGDVLFFFCSGFMLFQKEMNSFDNWYGHRINRIYPTVFSWAIISSVFFSNQQDMKSVLLYGGGGFVTAIMIYYIAMFIINKYFQKKEIIVGLFLIGIIGVYYYFFPYKYGIGEHGIYGDKTIFRWVIYFAFILLGAYIGNGTIKIKELSKKTDIVFLGLSVIAFYGIQVVAKIHNPVAPYQIFSILPLLSTTYFLYKVSNSGFLLKLLQNQNVRNVVLAISGLTLEIYLVQFTLIKSDFNHLFPLNLLIITVEVIILAYLLRCLSRIFIQTFKGNGYSWGQVFKLV
jgi:surface polysaccharide O-acyltransferase-like enzyme